MTKKEYARCFPIEAAEDANDAAWNRFVYLSLTCGWKSSEAISARRAHARTRAALVAARENGQKRPFPCPDDMG